MESATGTMPQGVALSPDGRKLAVVDAGFAPAALEIFDARTLANIERIALSDAFGIPVWKNANEVYVAGGSANAIFDVDLQTKRASALPAGNWTASVAVDGTTVAAANDANDTVSIDHIGIGEVSGSSAKTGSHPGALALFAHALFVANRGTASLSVVTWPTEKAHDVAVDLHPSALAPSPDGKLLYVACADGDAIDVLDVASERVVARIAVGLPQGAGASPNGLAVAADGTLYVSLGAQNAVAEIRDGRVVARVPAGWYPTGVAVDAKNVYVIDGKGESSHPNPAFDSTRSGNDPNYVGRLLAGSLRAIPRSEFTSQSSAQVVANLPAPQPTPPQTVLRTNGPIRHVIYIIKENRTYDQVLGDVAEGNGDPRLAWFGENVTPNQHAIARRFGIFDNTYTDAQVSAAGHTWSTAALANDYLERFWPPNYGGRRATYDFEDGAVASTPRNGYIWDNAARHGITYRDYGEFVAVPALVGFETTQMKGLQHHIDPLYRGFDLQASDEARVDEWQREFTQFVRGGNLPALEIMRLPNDHTAYTKTGFLTPQAYVAQNDRAFGRIVDAVSHSPYWKSTAIFAIEDDAQNGPDHVDDQRTTFYLASPYASGGVHHTHYSSTAVLRTIELLLGLPPMSIYDAVAPPMYDAFDMRADMRPFSSVAARVDVNARNAATAYGAAVSNRMDTRDADDVDERAGNDILAHAAGMEEPR